MDYFGFLKTMGIPGNLAVEEVDQDSTNEEFTNDSTTNNNSII